MGVFRDFRVGRLERIGMEDMRSKKVNNFEERGDS
jgi:hypothetical protein